MLSADAIDREGLTVPKMPQSAVDKMREYVPVAGSSVNNPIDAFPPEERLEDMLRLVASAEGIDVMFMSPMTGWRRPPPGSRAPKSMRDAASQQDANSSPDPEAVKKEMTENAMKAAQQMSSVQEDTGTPVIGVLRGGRMAAMMGQNMDSLSEAAYRKGIGIYPGVARAARTVAQILEWKEYRKGLPDIF